MIIAGFSGVGKTTFCKNNKDAIDFVIMPYKYEDLEVISKLYDSESIKAAPELWPKDNWEEEYYEALLDKYYNSDAKYIVIPTDLTILEWLNRDGIPFTLVYPDMELKDTYRELYVSRGNTQEFLDVFIEYWESWIVRLKRMPCTKRIVLQKNQFLSDVQLLDDIKTFQWGEYTVEVIPLEKREEYLTENDKEMDRLANQAVKEAIENAKQIGSPIAKYDPIKKVPYYEMPDGTKREFNEVEKKDKAEV